MSENTERTHEFEYPEESYSVKRIKRYLMEKGIDEGVIDTCIDRGILYESYPYHNVVYIGHDPQGNIKSARYQSIYNDNIRGMVHGSEYNYGFGTECADSDELHVFETPLELLSYATLMKMKAYAWAGRNMVSLNGVHQSRVTGETVMPGVLKQYLLDHMGVKAICLHFRESERGRAIAEDIKRQLEAIPEAKYTVTKVGMKDALTVNEYLMKHRGKGDARGVAEDKSYTRRTRGKGEKEPGDR